MYIATLKVGFIKDELHLNDLVSVLQSLTGILGKSNIINLIYLDLSRVFHIMSFFES